MHYTNPHDLYTEALSRYADDQHLHETILRAMESDFEIVTGVAPRELERINSRLVQMEQNLAA